MRLSRPPHSIVPILVGIALVAGSFTTQHNADAAVVHLQGFQGTVAGWRSWYGSYGLGPLGTGWCIDHGLKAPDAVYGYVATDLSGVPESTRVAMGWAVGRNNPSDRVGSAAMMLVLHDLMGAVYPTGRLNVDTLRPQDLRGFEGSEGAVVDRARQYKRDALSHAHLRGPLSVTIKADPALPGKVTAVEASVRDRNGSPVEGALVEILSPTSGESRPGVRSDKTGKVRSAFTVVKGDNRFEARVRVPSVTLSAWRPTGAQAQRVAVPEEQHLRAADGFTAKPPTGELIVHKTGDAEPSLPVAGAAFDVTSSSGKVIGRFNVGVNGFSGALRLEPGAYTVTEVRRPAGYSTAPPVSATVHASRRTTVEIQDKAVRSRLRIHKTSSLDNSPLPGAVIEIRYDRDGDGRFETPIATLTTGEDGSAELADLLPGSYQAIEVQAPPDHTLSPAPVPFIVPLDGLGVDVEIVNKPRATVRFEKIPVGHAPDSATLAGATFVVVRSHSDEGSAGQEVGRCTTGATGSCSLPEGALDAGAHYCWLEEVAPIGWAVADPGCFSAGPAGSTVTVQVRERSRFADVTARKVDAADGRPLAGATYDLFRVDLALLDRQAPPDVTEAPPGASWIGRASSDASGILRWPLVEPDSMLCIVEHSAPVGYLREDQSLCSSTPHRPESPAHFEVSDRKIPKPPEEPPATTSTVPPTSDVPPTSAVPTTTAVSSTTTRPLDLSTTTAPSTTAPSTTEPTPTSGASPTTRQPGLTTTVPTTSAWTWSGQTQLSTGPRAALPVTGSRSGPLTAAGALMIAIGFALQVPERRRR